MDHTLVWREALHLEKTGSIGLREVTGIAFLVGCERGNSTVWGRDRQGN